MRQRRAWLRVFDALSTRLASTCMIATRSILHPRQIVRHVHFDREPAVVEPRLCVLEHVLDEIDRSIAS